METRLKKTQQKCCICYEIAIMLGEIDSCTHAFCFECIRNWS